MQFYLLFPVQIDYMLTPLSHSCIFSDLNNDSSTMQWCTTPTCRVSITNSTFGTQPIAAPFSYKYFSECFLAEFALFRIHQIQSVTLQLQTVNRWQEATVMNFSSCLGSWQADCFDLKVWGGAWWVLEGRPQGHGPGVSLLKRESEAVKVWHMS